MNRFRGCETFRFCCNLMYFRSYWENSNILALCRSKAEASSRLSQNVGFHSEFISQGVTGTKEHFIFLSVVHKRLKTLASCYFLKGTKVLRLRQLLNTFFVNKHSETKQIVAQSIPNKKSWKVPISSETLSFLGSPSSFFTCKYLGSKYWDIQKLIRPFDFSSSIFSFMTSVR